MTELRLGQINTVDIDTSEFASANAVNTVQANVTSLDTDVSTISANLNALPDSAANDYTTYSTLSTLIDTVSSNASSHSSTFWEGYADTTALAGGYISNGFTVVSGVGAYFGEGGSWTQLATLASVNTVNDNVAALDNNAWVNANDYSTYNTLSGLIDTVQDNISSSSSTTDLYIDNTLISNSALFIESGNGLSVTANATSKVVTFTVGMSNVTSQEFTANGSSNTFTLAKSVSNSHMILVSYNGLLQKPTTYDISGTTLTLSNTLPIKANSDVEVRFFDFFDLPGIAESGGGGGYSFQGSNFGYITGGAAASVSYTDAIEKFSFTSDASATNIGSLSATNSRAAGQSSDSFGYDSASNSFSYDRIEKFPFASDTNSSSVGSLTQGRYWGSGHSSSTSGYTSGGFISPGPTALTRIDKFPFSSDTNASTVGALATAQGAIAGQSSDTSGYTSGGATSWLNYGNIIEKFPFSSDTNSASIGNLTTSVHGGAGQSSTTHGYNSGGNNGLSIIAKFPFSSDTNATEVASLSSGRRFPVGQSSTSYGYSSGGRIPPNTRTDLIDKFPFSSDSNATDVGELTDGKYAGAGQQY